MRPQKQKIVNNKYGDCFAACIASILELPIEVIPNDHSPNYHFTYTSFLGQFGLTLECDSPKGAIWKPHPWIASVKSLNYSEGIHSIVMHDGGLVLFDPSTKKRYKTGEILLGKNIVVAGWDFAIQDFSKLENLQKYREQLGY